MVLNTLGLEWSCGTRKVRMQIARVGAYTYSIYVVENKEVPDRNIDVRVPPVRKYADYRTL